MPGNCGSCKPAALSKPQEFRSFWSWWRRIIAVSDGVFAKPLELLLLDKPKQLRRGSEIDD